MLKIIFCSFNEEENLQKFLPNLIEAAKQSKEDFEIIICLDGGNDNSQELINGFKNSAQITILPIINQRGLGIAYKRLFLDVIQNSADEDLIISLDCDNTHNPQQILEMLNHLQETGSDLLVASRFCNKSVIKDFPLYRKFISLAVSFLLQNLFPIKKIDGKKLQDYSSGYRLYKAKILKELFKKEGDDFILEPEFTYTCELLIKLSRLNLRIDEIALTYDYAKKIGKSKLHLGRNFVRLIIMLKNLLLK